MASTMTSIVSDIDQLGEDIDVGGCRRLYLIIISTMAMIRDSVSGGVFVLS